jgi:hypothetical protein
LPHVLVQHTLSTQVSTCGLWRHICVREHAPPIPWSASQRFVVRLQKNVGVQSLSDAQLPWHAVPVTLHGVVAPHATGACAGHVPLLHVTAGIACAFGMTPEHDGSAPHGVVFGMGVLQSPP